MFGFSLAIVTSTKTQPIITHYRTNVAFFLCPPPLLRHARCEFWRRLCRYRSIRRRRWCYCLRQYAPRRAIACGNTPPLGAAMSLSLHTPLWAQLLCPWHNTLSQRAMSLSLHTPAFSIALAIGMARAIKSNRRKAPIRHCMRRCTAYSPLRNRRVGPSSRWHTNSACSRRHLRAISRMRRAFCQAPSTARRKPR